MGALGYRAIPAASADHLRRALRDAPTARWLGLRPVAWDGIVRFGIREVDVVTGYVTGYLAAAANRLQISVMRIAMIISYLPLLIFLYGLTVVDALVRRQLRRLRVEPDRGYIFHRLNRVRGLALWWPFFLVLAVPGQVPAPVVFGACLPGAAYLWINMTFFKRNI